VTPHNIALCDNKPNEDLIRIPAAYGRHPHGLRIPLKINS
jgi:hypothetical protein